VLVPYAPLGLITTAVQALAGIMLPSSTVFAILLGNDRAVLGPWVNRPWLNLFAGLIVGVLIVLSMILVISTVIPSIDVTRLLLVLGSAMTLVLVGGSVWFQLNRGREAPAPELSKAERENWRMPALALLERPTWSLGRRIAMLTLSGYLVLAIVLLGVKAVQLAIER
jgi:hypothetical protein